MCEGDHKTIAKAIKDRVSLISRKRVQRQQVSYVIYVYHLLKCFRFNSFESYDVQLCTCSGSTDVERF